MKLDRHEEGAELYKALLSINPDNYRWFNLLNISEKKENVHLTEMTGLPVNVAVCVFVIPTMNLATSVFCLPFLILSKTNLVIWNWYPHCRCLPHIFGYYNFWWVILFGVTRFVLKFTMNQMYYFLKNCWNMFLPVDNEDRNLFLMFYSSLRCLEMSTSLHVFNCKHN